MAPEGLVSEVVCGTTRIEPTFDTSLYKTLRERAKDGPVTRCVTIEDGSYEQTRGD